MHTLKIALYYIAYNLGHTRFVFNLIRSLKSYFGKDVSVIVMQNGRSMEHLPFDKYCKLFIFNNDYVITNTSGEIKALSHFKKNISLMKYILDKFLPDICITEFYPFVSDPKSFEITFLLEYIKRKINAKLFASIGYVMWKDKTFGILKEFYDGVLCHFPQDYLREYLNSPRGSREGKDLFKKVEKHFGKNIFFTGFMSNPDSKYPKGGCFTGGKDFKKTILISRGGGLGSNKNKRDFIITCIRTAAKMPEYRFIISTGPFLSTEEFGQYKKVCDNIDNITLHKYIPNFISILKQSHLSISMAGYNTIIEALLFCKKCIVVPCNNEEQMVRAYFLSAKYRVASIFPENFTIEELRKVVNREIQTRDSAKINYRDFCGVKNTIQWIKDASRP